MRLRPSHLGHTAVRWWRRCHFRRWGHPSYDMVWVEAVDDVPHDPGPRRAYLAGPGDQPKWLVLECPCGRGHTLMLSLQDSHSPHWSACADQSGLRVRPSVDYRSTAGHRCHFWLRDGRVRWV